MDRRVDVRHFVHRRSCDISSSNMAAYERWPRVSGRGTKYSTEVCRMYIWLHSIKLIIARSTYIYCVALQLSHTSFYGDSSMCQIHAFQDGEFFSIGLPPLSQHKSDLGL